jgi:AcrR family transcriptional regulator
MLVTVNSNVHHGRETNVPSSNATDATPETRRSKAKSDRRSQLISAAEQLIAENGFLAVRLEDIGAAVGVTGPAIYRHFANKEALLVELLVGISTRLLAGAHEVVARRTDATAALDDLIDFHLDFVFSEPDLIRIQDRDLAHLPATAKRQVRRSQRQYVEIWVDVLRTLSADLREDDARVVAHAAFGLLNSIPYSVKAGAVSESSRAVLRAMTLAALASARPA